MTTESIGKARFGVECAVCRPGYEDQGKGSNDVDKMPRKCNNHRVGV